MGLAPLVQPVVPPPVQEQAAEEEARSPAAVVHLRARRARIDRRMGPCLSPLHVSVSRSARAIVPRMLVISAIRETEAWSGGTVTAGVIIAVVAVSLLVWQIRRFLGGPPE